MRRYPNKLKQLILQQRGYSQPSLLLVLAVLLAVFGVLVVNRQNFYDWLKLRSYDPPGQIVAIADQTTLTDYGRKIFYVNHPEIEGKAAFIEDCPASTKEQTIVLGCYHGNQRGIFLLDVNDPRLDGVEQVTAAHEMLHAAYDRLSSKERQRIDGLLTEYYNNVLTDERIKKTIDAYRKTEPHDLVNEMHSIFATEITDLPKPLEDHYSRYFKNRKQVVAFAAKYQREFSSRHEAVQRADARLAELKRQIEASETEVRAMQSQIEQERSELTALRNSGNINAYNAGVGPYNALIDAYNQRVRALQAVIAEFNVLVAERNAIAVEENALVEELRTNVAPINR